MVVTKIFDPYRVFLMGMAVFFFIICSILYIVRGRTKEVLKDRFLMYGFAFVFLGAALNFLFRFLADTQVIGYYMEHGFYGDFANHTPLYDVFGKLVDTSVYLSVIIFFISLEYYKKSRRYPFTIILLIYFIGHLIVIIPYPIEVMYDYGTITGVSIVLPILMIYSFMWLIRNSQEDFKIISAIIIFGYLITNIGIWMDAMELKQLTSFVLYLSPIFLVLGSLMIISPLIVNPDNLSALRRYWRLLAFSSLISCYSFTIYVIILDPVFATDLVMIFNYVFDVVLLIIVIQTNKLMKEKTVLQTNVLSIFTKPKKLTEEEVFISKEKKICLVCKSNISELTYVCYDCHSFYCNKCYLALVDLENSCWACDVALDRSKPVKEDEKKQEEMAIEPVEQKDTPKKV